MGRSFFEKVLRTQSLCRADLEKVRNIIQTNGTLLDADWIALFREHNVQVGISFDGIPELHDKHRRYAATHSATSAVIIENIRRLRRAQVPFGVLCVVTDELLEIPPQTIVRYLYDLGVRRIGFLPERPYRDTFAGDTAVRKLYSKRRAFARFMCEAYDHWLAIDDPELRIRELASILDPLLGGRSTMCLGNGPCVGKHVGVDVTGRMSHCDKFFDDSRFAFGSIPETRTSNLIDAEKLERAAAIESNIRDMCSACPWFSLCQGGCLYEAMLFMRSGLVNRAEWCHLKPIYDYVCSDADKRLASALSTGEGSGQCLPLP